MIVQFELHYFSLERKMKFDLGVFGQVTVDIQDSFYLQDWINLPDKCLVGLYISFDFFELESVPQQLAYYLKQETLSHLDRYVRESWQQDSPYIQQFVHNHYATLAPELSKYHQLEQGDIVGFLNKLTLCQISFNVENAVPMMSLEYSIDRDLSDEMLKMEFTL